MSDASDRNSFNTKVIEEFRANHGQLSGPFAGGTMLLLHHTGAKSGTERVNPLAYLAVGDAWAIFASKAGAPSNPDWFHNLKANPDTTIEVGDETVAVRARVTHGDERTRIWTEQKAAMPGFEDYEAKTDREIPVILLERR